MRDPHHNNGQPSLQMLIKLVTKAILQQQLLQNNPSNKGIPLVSLKYYDDDGDLIQLDTDEDLAEALKYPPKHGLKLKVFENAIPPPPPQPRDGWLFPKSAANSQPPKRSSGISSSFLSDIYETFSMGGSTDQATARNNPIDLAGDVHFGAQNQDKNAQTTVVMGQPCDPAGHSRTSVRRPYNHSVAPTPRNSSVAPTPRVHRHTAQELHAAEDHVQRHLMKLRDSREARSGSSAHPIATESTTASSAIARSRMQSGGSSYTTIELSLHRRRKYIFGYLLFPNVVLSLTLVPSFTNTKLQQMRLFVFHEKQYSKTENRPTSSWRRLLRDYFPFHEI